MATEVILPKLGQTMADGTILEWLKAEGDPVQRGEVLFTTESDKATLEVEAPGKGVLRRILVPAGQTVPVLTVVGLITRGADEDISAYGSPAQAADAQALEIGYVDTVADSRVAQEPEAQKPVAPKPRSGRIFSSPRARKLAREENVDLALVTGTGPSGRIKEQDVIVFLESRPKATPVALKVAESLGVDITGVAGTGAGGRITRTDVEAAAKPTALPAVLAIEDPAVESVPLTGLRRVISERMAASARTTAHVTLVTEVDATVFVDARMQLKADVTDDWGFAPSYNDLLAIITARALRESPYINARMSADGTAVERLAEIHLGMAVDTDRGLLVPVIRNADQKGLRAFGAEFRAVMERARAGKALPDELTGGTFTITNLGMYDIDVFTPIINLPEAAILGVGRIQPKPVVRDGDVIVRQMLQLSLAFDHRLVDGAPAARFLQRIKQLIENPYLLLS
jgi:pyruvate dehydrogenase E2 component (dihydrolipoamide acetyltransferase)